jgi:membrane protease YdiL (CAAX protease family)
MTSLSQRAESLPTNRSRDGLDILMLVIAAVVIQLGVSRVGGVAGAVIGVFSTVLIAWGLLALRGERWRDLGLRRPRPWWTVLVWTLAVMIIFFCIKTFIGPLLGRTPDLSRFAAVHGDLATYLQILASIWIASAVIEELVFRGFLLSRLANLFGPTAPGLLLACLIQGALFGAVHAYQGMAGVILTGIGGLVLAAVYFLSGRNLWTLIIAHGAVDSWALTRIFLFGVPGAEASG